MRSTSGTNTDLEHATHNRQTPRYYVNMIEDKRLYVLCRFSSALVTGKQPKQKQSRMPTCIWRTSSAEFAACRAVRSNCLDCKMVTREACIKGKTGLKTLIEHQLIWRSSISLHRCNVVREKTHDLKYAYLRHIVHSVLNREELWPDILIQKHTNGAVAQTRSTAKTCTIRIYVRSYVHTYPSSGHTNINLLTAY